MAYSRTDSGLLMPSSLTHEIGHSNNGITGMYGFGFDAAEPNVALQWPQSVLEYDKMRRDAKVTEIFGSVTLPLRATRWYLDPNGAKKKVVDLISEDFDLPVLGKDEDRPRRRLANRFSWQEHLRMALLELFYGHMPFELVVDGDELRRSGQARLKKLAPRMPQTIARIQVARDGGLEALQQHPAGMNFNAPGPQEKPIPVESLLWYAHAREGGNWQGLSMFRSAYAPWKLKQDAMRVNGMKDRRNGMGVPQYIGPVNATQDQLIEGARYAESWRAGETGGGAAPFGGKIELTGVTGQLPDVIESLRWYDEQIAACVMAEFLKLGSTTTGSRSLASVFVDTFMVNLEAIGRHIADVTTAYAVEKFVTWNFGEDVLAPRIVFDPVDSPETASAIVMKAYVDSGVVVADDSLEHWVRSRLKAPRKDPNAGPRPLPMAPPGGANVNDTALPAPPTVR